MFFPNLNLSTFKTPPDLYSVVKCFTASFNSTLVPLEKQNFKNCWFMSWSLFQWMVHCKSGFPNLKRVDGTTQGEFVSGSVNSKAAYFEYRMCLPAGLLPRNKHWKFEPTMLPRRFNSGNLPALRIQISGHGFINITAERLRHTVYERGYFTYRSFKGLRKPFERIPNGILFEHYLNTLRNGQILYSSRQTLWQDTGLAGCRYSMTRDFSHCTLHTVSLFPLSRCQIPFRNNNAFQQQLASHTAKPCGCWSIKSSRVFVRSLIKHTWGLGPIKVSSFQSDLVNRWTREDSPSSQRTGKTATPLTTRMPPNNPPRTRKPRRGQFQRG